MRLNGTVAAISINALLSFLRANDTDIPGSSVAPVADRHLANRFAFQLRLKTTSLGSRVAIISFKVPTVLARRHSANVLHRLTRSCCASAHTAFAIRWKLQVLSSGSQPEQLYDWLKTAIIRTDHRDGCTL